jgi:hypothetical protein
MSTRAFIAVGTAGLCCAQALAATTAASAGPWAQVPELPTVCYSSQDPWSDQNNAAIEAVQEVMYAQQEKNSALEQQANQAMSEDPMAMAQAMQQAMMDDPANAQKMIERMTQTGQQAQTELPAQLEKEKQLEAESKSVLQEYKAALDKAMQPAVARWNALQKKMGNAVEPGFPIGPDPSWPSWAWQEWAGIQKNRDAAYVANCAQWWSATGGFQAYMKRYKDYLVQERIPYEKKLGDEGKLNNFKLLGVPADDYRTTTDYEAAIDYMKMASSLYGERMADPFCRMLNACE